jgi:TRAP-type C4-dicarboxylate transport system permease small subunit
VPDAGPGAQAADAGPARRSGTLLERALERVHALVMALVGLALVASCVVLTTSVVLRYGLHAPTDWQDEVAVFLLVFVTFASSGWVQALRGHVAIDAVTGLLPARVERVRRRVADALCLVFCAFFAWKSWALTGEAWTEGMTTSSTWGPPLWIPYGLMAGGMSLLVLQLLLQTLAPASRVPS